MKINKEFIKDLKTWRFNDNPIVNKIYTNAVLDFLDEYKMGVILVAENGRVFIQIISTSPDIYCPYMASIGAEKVFESSFDIAYHAEDTKELEALKMLFESKSKEIEKMIEELKKDTYHDYD